MNMSRRHKDKNEVRYPGPVPKDEVERDEEKWHQIGGKASNS